MKNKAQPQRKPATHDINQHAISVITFINTAAEANLTADIIRKYLPCPPDEAQVLIITRSNEDIVTAPLAAAAKKHSVLHFPASGKELQHHLEQLKHPKVLFIFAEMLKKSFPIREIAGNYWQDKTEIRYFHHQVFSSQPPTMMLLDRSMAAEIIMSMQQDSSYAGECFSVAQRLPGKHEHSIAPQIETNKSVGTSIPGRIKGWLNFYFITPFRKELSPAGHEPRIFRFIFMTAALILLFLMPFLSYDAGISGDEDKHVEQAVKVYNYFKTAGADTSYMVSKHGPFYAYNITFDVAMHGINTLFHIDKIYESRHIMTSLTGWLAIFITGLLIAILAGYRAGLIAMFLLFFTPVFLGHTYNNPKDIPFAMANGLTLYYIIRFVQCLPLIRIRYAIGIAIGVALSLNIRIGGLILIIYLFAFTAMYIFFRKDLRSAIIAAGHLPKLFMVMLLASFAGYVLGIITWPYALTDPINHPIDALKNMTNFQTSLRQLYDGKIIWSDQVPWYYALKYMWITIPVVVFVGMVLFFIPFGKININNRTMILFILIFSFVFPVVYIIYKKSNVYGGWRHLLFVYLSMAGVAAMGLESMIRLFKSRRMQLLALLAIVPMALHPILHTIRNHPHEYIYYNELIGGTEKAYGKFEMDYYFHSLKASSEWLIKTKIDTLKPGNKIIVASNYSPALLYYFRHYRDKVKIIYTRYYDRGEADWDYGIFGNTFIDPFHLKRQYWPPKNTIHQVKVDQSPICAVVERKHKYDYYGYKALNENNLMMAMTYFEQAIKEDPQNETALLHYARALTEVKNYQRAHELLDRCLTVYPNYEHALEAKGMIYLQNFDLNNAISMFNRIIQINIKYVNAYYYLGYAYLMNNRPYDAIAYLQQCLEQNGSFKPAYFMMAEALKRIGKTDEAKLYTDYGNKL